LIRTTKRFPSPRCASATKIVRPSESMAETQPQLQPALVRLSAMISQDFTRPGAKMTETRGEQKVCLRVQSPFRPSGGKHGCLARELKVRKKRCWAEDFGG
jgi:hypothetical protein